ncbi:uncharacterized protein EV420DRAFT_1644904 [Desarmillaria tabescens]|uniref:Uncharacterized protein n=1 Tax=Armillaria tabescens TaxID=1929756 RepID=A0AA39K8A3_ARMTA|nr:uncharacterized protein EV420DRAFT_1644904 [Desarmillaria tabescens]KAK0455265.1 hypothetical protein EV420DRAFT_1644904 [Desarmillaria tabescens]
MSPRVRNFYLRCGHAVNLPEETYSIFPPLSRLHANSPTASSVHSTLRAAGRLLATRPVGNITDILNNIPPKSTGIAPPAARLCSTAAEEGLRIYTVTRTFH